MQCASCGRSAASADDRFCSGCGQPLPVAPRLPAPAPAPRVSAQDDHRLTSATDRPAVWLIGGVVLLAGLIGVTALLAPRTNARPVTQGTSHENSVSQDSATVEAFAALVTAGSGSGSVADAISADSLYHLHGWTGRADHDTVHALAEVRRKVVADSMREAEATTSRLRAEALGSMKKEYDEFRGITWYQDRTHPRYANNSTVRGYIGVWDSGSPPPVLRLLLRYSGDSWLFVRSFTVKVDGGQYPIVPERYTDVERDNGGGDVWEWHDVLVGPREYLMMRAIAEGKDVKIRYEGDQYYKDRTIPESERAAMRRVLRAYAALGGTIQ